MDSSTNSSANSEGKKSQSAGGGYGSDPNSPGNDIDVSPNSGMTSSGGTGGGMGGGTTPSGSGNDTTLGQPGEGQSQSGS